MITQEILFTKEECEYIISLGSDYKTVGHYKQPECLILTDSHKGLNQFLFDKFKKFSLDHFPPYIKILRYHEGVYFNLHKDSNGFDLRRKTIIVQLSDSNDYTGGNLTIRTGDGKVVADRDQGNAIIYPASALHEVSKVESGIRYIMVTWLENKHLLKVNKLL